MTPNRQPNTVNIKTIMLYIAAAVLSGGGLYLGYLYLQSMDMFMAVGTVALLGGGIFLFYKLLKKGNEGGGGANRVGKKKITTPKLNGEENSLNFYAVKDGEKLFNDRMVFEKVEKPLGPLWRWRKNNQLYHLHRIGADGVMNAVRPPDRLYVDPEWAAGFLDLGPQRKYLKNRESMLKFIGPGILLVGFIVEVIFMLAKGG